jgi:hypothetical protein
MVSYRGGQRAGVSLVIAIPGRYHEGVELSQTTSLVRVERDAARLDRNPYDSYSPQEGN